MATERDKSREYHTEVKTYLVEMYCPECKTGRLESTGMCLTSNPPQYPHKCTNCIYEETFVGVTYPHYEQVPVGGYRG